MTKSGEGNYYIDIDRDGDLDKVKDDKKELEDMLNYEKNYNYNFIGIYVRSFSSTE